MPSPFVPLPVPLVPLYPGVPTLPTSLPGAPPSSFFPSIPTLATGNLFSAGPLGQNWGIFTTGGATILQADAVAYVEYLQDYRISDYPQEQGSFASYNKVQVPFQAKVGFLVNQSREAFLQGIGQQLASLDLVQVVTPEITYPSANLTHYGYRRSVQNGVTMILIDVWCEEVRITATTQLSNTTTQNGQQPVDAGTTQPEDTTTQPINQVTGTVTTLVSPPNALVNPSGTSLTTPNIGPAFYTADNLPAVPNDASALTSSQVGSTLTFGQSIGAGAVNTTVPDENGNVLSEYATVLQ